MWILLVERDELAVPAAATQAMTAKPVSMNSYMQLCTLHKSCCDVSRPSCAKVCAN
jgi:hypothetical protein